MLEYTNEINDFNELEYLVWGQAVKILEEIYNANKEDEFMEHLADVFSLSTPTLTEINDYISYDWEEIYEAIGMTDKFDYDDDLVMSLLHSNIDNLREMGHHIKEPTDADLDYIFLEISKETYEDEEELDDYVYDLILTYLEEDEDDDD